MDRVVLAQNSLEWSRGESNPQISSVTGTGARERVAGSVAGLRHPLSLLVERWPHLSTKHREAILLIADIEAASAGMDATEPTTRLSCTVDERSNARQGVQCELGSGADESVVDSTGTARRPAGRGEAAADGDSGEVRL